MLAMQNFILYAKLNSLMLAMQNFILYIGDVKLHSLYVVTSKQNLVPLFLYGLIFV